MPCSPRTPQSSTLLRLWSRPASRRWLYNLANSRDTAHDRLRTQLVRRLNRRLAPTTSETSPR
ncbi:MAG: hypothetical protein KatS3mg108_2487 [Isosphaeraceae bacterium]|jgi:hypothetical protein|nr:MAG: hypothetical protein KatS3mg108_2487 [Isosphaeraceae bacterium]